MMDRHLHRWFKDFRVKNRKLEPRYFRNLVVRSFRWYNNEIEVIIARNCQDTKHQK